MTDASTTPPPRGRILVVDDQRNVRLSTADTPAVLETFRATFEGYWEDPHVEPYEAEKFAAASGPPAMA